METAMTEAATTADLGTAVGVAVLKQAQQASEAEALALLQTIPQAPSFGGVGNTVDISA